MENQTGIEIPVIDMGGEWLEVVAGIKKAAETWGVFRIVNHRIPDAVLEALLDGIKRFHHHLPSQAKAEYIVNDNIEGKIKTKISLGFDLHDDIVEPQHFPPICRNEMEDYAKSVIDLKERISEMLSEALGLEKDYLSQSECLKRGIFRCHYYEACPQQDNSSGLKMHTDLLHLTILVQDHVGGLQVLHDDTWVDVPPQRGSLIANIGDSMQLITNGKFKSVVHRVVSSVNEARISAVVGFMPSLRTLAIPFSPIKELLSENNPPLYKNVTFQQLALCYFSDESQGFNALNQPTVKA